MGKTVGKMKLGPMAVAVLKLVRERPGTSWVELCRYIDGATGERPVMAAPNVVLWWGVSDELIDTLNELRNAGLLEIWNCSLLLYAADGLVPMLPVAVPERLDSYRTPHWLPSVFQLPHGAAVRPPGGAGWFLPRGTPVGGCGWRRGLARYAGGKIARRMRRIGGREGRR